MAEHREKHDLERAVTVPAPRSDVPSPRASKCLELPARLPPAVEQSALILPNGKFVTTLTLNSRTCRWPLGDPAELDFHYCGQPPNSRRPYCNAHELRGYQPVRSRSVHRPPQTH